jgi:hypothetical protein
MYEGPDTSDLFASDPGQNPDLEEEAAYIKPLFYFHRILSGKGIRIRI